MAKPQEFRVTVEHVGGDRRRAIYTTTLRPSAEDWNLLQDEIKQCFDNLRNKHRRIEEAAKESLLPTFE